jgi:hypothetical protein
MACLGPAGNNVCNKRSQPCSRWSSNDEDHEREKSSRSVALRRLDGIASTDIELLETRDGKRYYDPAPHSNEMRKLNTSFATIHGISSLLNLGGYLATIWYGVTLAGRIQ